MDQRIVSDVRENKGNINVDKLRGILLMEADYIF